MAAMLSSQPLTITLNLEMSDTSFMHVPETTVL